MTDRDTTPETVSTQDEVDLAQLAEAATHRPSAQGVRTRQRVVEGEAVRPVLAIIDVIAILFAVLAVQIAAVLIGSGSRLYPYWASWLGNAMFIAFVLVDALTGLSPAKLLFNSRVRKLDGKPADAVQLVLRATLKWMFAWLPLIIAAAGAEMRYPSVVLFWLLALIANLLSVAMVPFTTRKQTWYDMLTGTLVVAQPLPTQRRAKGRGFEVKMGPVVDATIAPTASEALEARERPDRHGPA